MSTQYKRRIYISGAITGTNNYLKRFEIAEDNLQCCGWDVINPAKICSLLPCSFQHWEYMNVCKPLLKMCDAMFILNDSGSSKGVLDEMLTATCNNITIYHEKDGLPKVIE